MEAEMKDMGVKQGKNAHSEDDNFDEAIPIQIRKKRTTEAYKEKMNEDIETIDKNDNRTVVQRTKWRPMYEVIDEYYIKSFNIFPDDFITKCKQFPNGPQTISSDVKNNIKRMEMEQSLYAQVIMFRRKDLILDAKDKNKNESKFKFQGQSARSQLWFDLDLDWINMNFSTREPDFYKKLFKSHENEQDTNTSKKFQFPIGNAKVVK